MHWPWWIRNPANQDCDLRPHHGRGRKDWKTLLPDVVKALNEAPSDALQGKAPDAIDDVAEFDLQKINAEKRSFPKRNKWNTKQNLQRLAQCGP